MAAHHAPFLHAGVGAIAAPVQQAGGSQRRLYDIRHALNAAEDIIGAGGQGGTRWEASEGADERRRSAWWSLL